MNRFMLSEFVYLMVVQVGPVECVDLPWFRMARMARRKDWWDGAWSDEEGAGEIGDGVPDPLRRGGCIGWGAGRIRRGLDGGMVSGGYTKGVDKRTDERDSPLLFAGRKCAYQFGGDGVFGQPDVQDRATDFGFFLDWNLLGQSTMQPMLRNRSPDRPSPALLNAVYMWGAHLAGDILTEDRFKYYALHCAATDLLHSHLHPHSFLHTLQAEVLLSHYFFRTGHFLEARSHTATAVALALGGGLHQIRSLHNPDVPVIEITREHENGLQLRAPADAIEEGERINAFWAVFMLQKNLAVALEPPVRICGMLEAGGIQIDTPWPLELDEYKKVQASHLFLSDAPS
ncbi:hypothetical protein B0H10DRAFT_2387533 [Mycena sp. CBHHK59/15]|nr:hypothetical protein B0H10DRAFT_2387533 [Mycena sp. CBHHK59/15]